jgi:antitoxin component of MazEF toxin-antitoxin module
MIAGNTMTFKIKARKVGTSLVMTITKDVALLFNIKEGTELEIEPMGSDSFRIKVK